MGKIICKTCGTENPVQYKYCFSCGYELPKTIIDHTPDTDTKPAKSERNLGKRIPAFIGFAVFFIVSFFAVQHFFFRPALLDDAMMKVASEINKSCPIMVDAETRLDNAVALPKNVFQYNYTLINMEKATVDTIEMRDYLEASITNLVRTNPQMKPQRDLRQTINYYYKDKNGLFLLLISVTPDKYE